MLPQAVAGVFIADDFAISQWSRLQDNSLVDFRDINPVRTRSTTNHPKNLLASALHDLFVEVPADVRLDAITFAVPGPILASGRLPSLSKENYGRLGLHRYGPQWYDLSLETVARNILASTHADRVTDRVSIRVYHDAAAYAFGHYILLRRAAAQENDFDETTFRRREVLVHILADEGVGSAVVTGGGVTQAQRHAESGHIPIRPHRDDLNFVPKCALHRNFGCLEGYVGARAIRKRWGDGALEDMADWPEDDPRLNILAFYLSQLCVVHCLLLPPTAIGFSGRLFSNPHLVGRVKDNVSHWLEEPNELRTSAEPNLYPFFSDRGSHPPTYHVAPKDAGVYGALNIAATAVTNRFPTASNFG